ncbi:hypothetical protein D3C78_1060960 [compost metagenome]
MIIRHNDSLAIDFVYNDSRPYARLAERASLTRAFIKRFAVAKSMRIQLLVNDANYSRPYLGRGLHRTL